MYLEVIVLGARYNQNIGLIKDSISDGKIHYRGMNNRIIALLMYSFWYWILFALIGLIDFRKSIENDVYIYDVNSHLNGNIQGSKSIHVSKIAFNKGPHVRDGIRHIKEIVEFVRTINGNGLYVANSREYVMFAIYSMYVNVNDDVRTVTLGWDDNWRSGAIIKYCNENNIDCCVFQHGLVSNKFRYIPYSARFNYFEPDFPQLVKNPLNIPLSSFEFKSRLKNIRYSVDGEEVIFLTKLNDKGLTSYNNIEHQVIIYHPLQKFSEMNKKKGFFLEELSDLRISKAYCMKSTIIYDMKYFNIPTVVI